VEDRDVAAVLEGLIETLEDSHKGFTSAADELGQEGYLELATELREFASQRARFASELRDLAAERGHDLSRGGSAAGFMHRRWLALREAVSGDPVSSVTAAIREGEDHARRRYDKALAEALPPAVGEIVSRQAREIDSVIERLRSPGGTAPSP
jgi:uncharacterized protein (TIGR02284 family)